MKKIISLFSGCGGMDIGFHGGFEVPKKLINTKMNPEWIESSFAGKARLKRLSNQIIFANDIKEDAKKVWKTFFDHQDVDDSIYKIGSIVDFVKTHKKKGNFFPKNVDILTGGFPCQDFSLAGKRKGFNSHKSHENKLINSYSKPTIEKRGNLYMWMKEVIELTKPKLFVAENVKGMISVPDVVSTIKNDFESVGYFVNYKILNAANYGVPQNRERIIFIGVNKSFLKSNLHFFFQTGEIPEHFDPFPKHTHQKEFENNLLEFSKPSYVFNDLIEPWYSNDISQKKYSKAAFLGKKNNSQGQVEINLNKISPTIRAEHHGNIEFRRLTINNGGLNKNEKYMRQRRLSVRECARIQTFPDTCEFVTNDVSMSSAYTLIGDALPCLFAYNIASKINEIWSDLF